MSDVAISVEGISKKYLIGHHVATSLSDRVRSLMGKKMIGSEEEFWALKDVSFEIKKGEAVGIIGKNGAGKSTLLKILSRITYPTTGRFEMNGRVSSLLEVGTGFHPELSGRENIFLNGTILGMSRREVKEKFDEIVDFSGVSKFLDTPVKHYSSGMYVRLAFAVAAHLEPEILIIDEVLAVGDAEFQKKCLGKMDEVAKQGRTVLFVSHNMGAVRNICAKSVLMAQGELKYFDLTDNCISKYLSERSSNTFSSTDRSGNGILKFQNIRFYNEKGYAVSQLICGMYARLEFSFIHKIETFDPALFTFEAGFDDELQNRILWVSNEFGKYSISYEQENVVIIEFEKLPIVQGNYSITVFSKYDGSITDWIPAAINMRVEDGDFFQNGKNLKRGQGKLLIDHTIHLK
ncbi:MAG: lipopolysaccharide transport system ATP-binding protein [Parvicella sp.]|jgi:lipopolysaccharide transport system ATP-binding protein